MEHPTVENFDMWKYYMQNAMESITDEEGYTETVKNIYFQYPNLDLILDYMCGSHPDIRIVPPDAIMDNLKYIGFYIEENGSYRELIDFSGGIRWVDLGCGTPDYPNGWYKFRKTAYNGANQLIIGSILGIQTGGIDLDELDNWDHPPYHHIQHRFTTDDCDLPKILGCQPGDVQIITTENWIGWNTSPVLINSDIDKELLREKLVYSVHETLAEGGLFICDFDIPRSYGFERIDKDRQMEDGSITDENYESRIVYRKVS